MAQKKMRSNRKRIKKNAHLNKTKGQKRPSIQNTSSIKKAAHTSQSKKPRATNPSLIETISAISKQIDLTKIRNHLSDVNEIVNQVSGVIQQINQWGRPAQQVYHQTPYYSHPVNHNEHISQPYR